MSEKCFRCGKLLPESYTMTIGGPPESTAEDIGWHWINAAPHAASGGTMVPVCNKCDPPPVLISRAQYEAWVAAAKALERYHHPPSRIDAPDCPCCNCEGERAIAALRAVGILEEE